MVSFTDIIEHTADIIQLNKGQIQSLLKLFDMFQLPLFDYIQDKKGIVVEMIDIRCINRIKETGLNLRYLTIDAPTRKISMK